LLHPPGLGFAAAFLGCLYAGVVAVPVFPPHPRRTHPRLVSIARDASPRLLLTTTALLPRVEGLAGRIPGLAATARVVATDAVEPERSAAWKDPEAGEETLAFLQYTSGSTSTPRGVLVTHGNLLHNEEMIRQAFGHSDSTLVLSWLPLYHDMGLIGGLLQPLYAGARCILMSPMAFLQRPARWLEAISRYRATSSGGPNFAYELCARKVGEEVRARLDLSSWTVAFNGSEPVRAETLERFSESFGPCGFRHEAHFPCYGLAEATLFVTGGAVQRPPSVLTVDPGELERARVAEPAGGPGRKLVGCGSPRLGQEVLVVEPETRTPLPEGRVGEIWIGGPSVAGGYWNRPEESAEVFFARLATREDDGRTFLRTGDLGFLQDGELFVTGRLKDLLIVRGRNVYPQDLELTAERSHPALRPGCGAAFAVEVEGEERIVLVHEVQRRVVIDSDRLVEAVRRAVAEEHEVDLHEVVLLREETLPKTPSGKVQRHACRELWRSGGLAVVGRGPRTTLETGGPGDLLLDRIGLLAGPPEERTDRLQAWLRERVARVLRLDAERIDPAACLGLDSLGAVELTREIEVAFGARIPVETLSGDASLEEIGRRLLAALDAEETPDPARSPGRAPFAGILPLLPSQRWFFERRTENPSFGNIPVFLEIAKGFDRRAFAAALGIVYRWHDALRVRIVTLDGERRQRFEPPGGPVPFHSIDLSAVPDERRTAALVSAASQVQPSLDLAAGPLQRSCWFDMGDASCDRLLVVTHHLLLDAFSLYIFFDDLWTAYQALAESRPVELPATTASVAEWIRGLEETVASPALAAEMAWWLEQPWAEAAPLPVDEIRGPNSRSSSRTVTVEIDAETGAMLLRELPGRLGVDAGEVLLAGLVGALAGWTGGDRQVVHLLGHGREPVVQGIDASRTVGWFATSFPVLLTWRQGDLLDALASIAAQVRAVPHHGIGFSLLRYFSADPEVRARMSAIPEARVELNYLGRYGWDSLTRKTGLRRAAEPCGPSADPNRDRIYLLRVTVEAQDDQSIRLHFDYSENVHRRSTVEGLAARCVTLLAALAGSQAAPLAEPAWSRSSSNPVAVGRPA
ncbi:MAG TPA: AMP-binding protein, partial [Thermoanaerobaculia bacterium]|nr:AMP-binding protein [Thermoanaerobaculia bacterium]